MNTQAKTKSININWINVILFPLLFIVLHAIRVFSQDPSLVFSIFIISLISGTGFLTSFSIGKKMEGAICFSILIIVSQLIALTPWFNLETSDSFAFLLYCILLLFFGMILNKMNQNWIAFILYPIFYCIAVFSFFLFRILLLGGALNESLLVIIRCCKSNILWISLAISFFIFFIYCLRNKRTERKASGHASIKSIKANDSKASRLQTPVSSDVKAEKNTSRQSANLPITIDKEDKKGDFKNEKANSSMLKPSTRKGKRKEEFFPKNTLEQDAISKKEGKLNKKETSYNSVSNGNDSVKSIEDTLKDENKQGCTSQNNNQEPILSNEESVFAPVFDADYEKPPLDLLKIYEEKNEENSEDCEKTQKTIIDSFASFGINIKPTNIVVGPNVSRYEFQMPSGVSISKVASMEGDIGYALGGKNARVLAPVYGKKAIGVEVANKGRTLVGLRDSIDSLEAEIIEQMKVPFVLGKDIEGDTICIDISKLPHLIIAGTTGSGKSVSLNCLINTILYTKTPSELKMVLVDPKIVELSIYDGIPHLLCPVLSEPEHVINMMKWLVDEMERRYVLLNEYQERNIDDLNELIDKKDIQLEKLPSILVVIDEFADLISYIGKNFELYIKRLAAKARAIGIHLIVTTQRPSSEIITGTLKANLPGRIAFAVSSKVNSKIILDQAGAENLIGNGDMLFLNPKEMRLKRIQGAYISTEEVKATAKYLKPYGKNLKLLNFEKEKES